jgi:hypothetical protein
MTGREADRDAQSPQRSARIVTDHGDEETAVAVARSVRPDNTAELTTREEGATVVTTITRGTTGGLQSTVDDYVVNVAVAAQLLEQPNPTHDT